MENDCLFTGTTKYKCPWAQKLIKHYLKGKDTIHLFPPIIYKDKLFNDSADIANIMNWTFTDQTQVNDPERQIDIDG